MGITGKQFLVSLMQGEKKECEAGGQTYAKGIHQQECQSAVVDGKETSRNPYAGTNRMFLGESNLWLRKSWVEKGQNPRRK